MVLTPVDREVRLRQVYSELDRKFEEQETQRKATTNKLPYINLYGYPLDPSALVVINPERSLAVQAVVFYKEGPNLKIGTFHPTPALKDLVKELETRGYYPELYQISESSFVHMHDGYSKVVQTQQKSGKIELDSKKQGIRVSSLKELAEHLSNASATELIDTLLQAALSLNSSDIHVEPEGAGIKIRYRIDGVLQDIAVLPKETHHPIVSRIKILAKLKLNLTTVPQDGSFSLTYNGTAVDIRVSILPSTYGESLVLRILRQDKGSLKFEELGIRGLAFSRLTQQMEKPNGMILTTGPTGSGKTTTLYAILNKLNEPGVKIITLEDPVEYKIQGITQSPIDSSQGLTFAAGLRAILRQDPDVVMVGEMRDLETAETAAQAALTGHVVLSTLHTNDAAGAIPRLIDLGVKPFVLSPAINAIIAQRLVRKICPNCKSAYTPEQHLLSRAEMILASLPKKSEAKVPGRLQFYRSAGCAACNGLGYKGRIGVYEIFTINEEIEKLIQKSASNSEIRNQAIADGMITMAQDGVLKALDGITDLEEVFRVTEA
ncbi:MAG: GspE/PulE family protein [Candidatus Saccharibacteria bacterium]